MYVICVFVYLYVFIDLLFLQVIVYVCMSIVYSILLSMYIFSVIL